MTVSNDIKYIGVNDRKIDLFEGQYKVPNGMCYNSYVIKDELTAVIDSVDIGFTEEWLNNLENALGGKEPDYLIIQHMEPDHSASIAAFLNAHPETIVVSNAKAFTMLENFFEGIKLENPIVVKDGDTLELGKHTLKFVFAPMVHWPEVMFTYEMTEKILFTADAFGKFGAWDTVEPWADEARRYYIGIVGKYGMQVQNVLKKAAALDIKTICPLHGPILKENLGYYLDLYNKWSSYTPETEGIVIAYTSVYGNTKKAALMLAEKLKSNGCPKVVIHDLARGDMAEAVSDAFRYSKLVLATTTYNADIFPFMRDFIIHLTERGFKNRTVGIIENGSWAPMAAKVIRTMMESCKNITWLENNLTIRSALKKANVDDIANMANELCAEYNSPEVKSHIDSKALFNIGYGLYVVTSNDGTKDNGLIVNTVTQISNNPTRISVSISKANCSHDIIKASGKMNVNVLTVDTPFSIFENFGFRSGKDCNKFENIETERTLNGLPILKNYINSYISLEVEDYTDMGSHGLFICKVTESKALNRTDTMTYTYYHKNVKPKPETKAKKGFVCKICGYVYEGDTLPADFVCPICKHGAEDFEEIK